MIERLSHSLRDERGIALVMALGILLALSITTVALVQYTGSHERDVRFLNARQKSVSIAEAGLNEAFSVLSNASDPRNPASLPPGSANYEGGSATWSGVINGDTWTVTATSTVKNPSGAADLHNNLTSQIRIGVDGAGYAPAWQYVYVDDASSCTEVENSASISAPLFVQGGVCLENSTTLTSASITIKGKATLKNSSSIGTSSTPISALHIGGGCSNSDSGHSIANCNAAHRVWANTVDSTYANIAKPTVDLPYWYLYSKPGPKNNCTSGSFPGGFDNNTTLDHSRSMVTLLSSTGYSCTVTSGASTLGKLIWTPGNPGTLQISGVIFFDGDVDIAGKGIYTGRGTIYSSGKITFDNDDYLCGAANCDVNAWDGDQNMIVFVAGSSSTPTGFSTKNSSKFQGGVYAVNDIEQENSTLIEGPMIARRIEFENSAVAQKWPPIDFIADGAPAPIGATKLIPVSGTYGGS